MRKKPVSFIQAAVPLQRGAAEHFEERSYSATHFHAGQVTEIHTPQEIVLRVHEVMHARHTKPDSYRGIRPEIGQIVEDCHLHTKYWPWRGDETPAAILESAKATVKDDLRNIKQYEKAGGEVQPVDKFLATMRANAVYEGMVRSRPFEQSSQAYTELEYCAHGHIQNGHHEAAAYLIQQAFFPDYEKDKKLMEMPGGSEEVKKDGKPSDTSDSRKKDEMQAQKGFEEILALDRIPDLEIIELNWVEETNIATVGCRIATTGPRIHRPSLRRPVLPQRIFMKVTPTAPGGAILFDSSGSMTITPEKLIHCCQRAPMATVAFYSGEDGGDEGKLYVYAKEGRRATDTDFEIYSGNACDGQALDWLMKQDGPRLFVTDREFCGSPDSIIQKVRLQMLEDLGEVTVYTSYRQYLMAHPSQSKQNEKEEDDLFPEENDD